MSYNQLISDPSTYVKNRAQRSGDSIFLRHMDDVVGTGPDEHLMIDFEHMKTSLYLTDSETASDQCQFMRSRVLRSKCLRRRTDGTRRALQGTSLQRFGSSRDGFRLGKTTFYSAGDQADSNTSKYDALQYNSVHERNVCRDSSGHEEQHCRSLHGTSGWIANTVAREETWTSNPGWYESYEWGRQRNGDDGELWYSASSRAGV